MILITDNYPQVVPQRSFFYHSFTLIVIVRFYIQFFKKLLQVPQGREK